jgi:ribosome-associated protein
MSRKTRKGYYVEGEFVAAGSALDRQFRIEQKGTDAPSRTELKTASEELQKLGEDLLTLREDLFAALPLPETLQDAILLAKRITNFEGKRRQKQFIGKLMHRLDAEALESVAAALQLQHSQSAQETLVLHRAEKWRDAMIADDEALAQWIKEFRGTDAQQLRALVRQARKEVREPKEDPSSGMQRQGRAYRQIFALVRTQLSSSVDTPS